MIKYRLSSGVKVLNPGDYTYADTPQALQEGHYILIDAIRSRDFLINETVKYFIEKFSLPKTSRQVVREIASDVQSDCKAVEKQCSSFFKFLCKKNILVPENAVERSTEKQTLLKPGDSMDGLSIVKVLSNKRYVDIYLVEDKTSNSQYVIKLLNRNKILDDDYDDYEEELTEFEAEYGMLQNVKHIPFVCQAYAFTKNHQNAYIKLEYIKGKSISRFLREAKDLNESQCFQIMREILQAFSLLHESKIIHGDIHPSNILIREDSSVKIIDLGLSIHESALENNEVLKFGGVNFYMPPERIRIASIEKFSKEPDFYSDVYQVGLIFYYMLFRKEPFTGFIWEELATNIKQGSPNYPALSFLQDPVPGPLIEIIKKCLNKNPVKRYPNATEILREFEKAID